MKIMRNNLLSIGAMLIFFLLAIASSPSKMTFGNSEKWLPTEFSLNKHILLIEKFHSEKTQEKAEQFLSDKYPYRYEFASYNDIYNKSGKLANTDLYRFALVSFRDEATMLIQRNNGTQSTMNVSGTDFGFFDRKKNEAYPKAGKGSSNALITFKPIINTIVKNAAQ